MSAWPFGTERCCLGQCSCLVLSFLVFLLKTPNTCFWQKALGLSHLPTLRCCDTRSSTNSVRVQSEGNSPFSDQQPGPEGSFHHLSGRCHVLKESFARKLESSFQKSRDLFPHSQSYFYQLLVPAELPKCNALTVLGFLQRYSKISFKKELWTCSTKKGRWDKNRVYELILCFMSFLLKSLVWTSLRSASPESLLETQSLRPHHCQCPR